MADPDETEIEITISPICLDCGEPIPDRAATSFCDVCERKLLSHLPRSQSDEETRGTESDDETSEIDTTSKGTVENDG